ncbi:hypothetical protein CPC08DRAFT_808979 [Agrocybe pediades]|nr:hypothetical protein CPC08DRAFT_808979 [Agrocybe pediades]
MPTSISLLSDPRRSPRFEDLPHTALLQISLYNINNATVKSPHGRLRLAVLYSSICSKWRKVILECTALWTRSLWLFDSDEGFVRMELTNLIICRSLEHESGTITPIYVHVTRSPPIRLQHDQQPEYDREIEMIYVRRALLCLLLLDNEDIRRRVEKVSLVVEEQRHGNKQVCHSVADDLVRVMGVLYERGVDLSGVSIMSSSSGAARTWLVGADTLP